MHKDRNEKKEKLGQKKLKIHSNKNNIGEINKQSYTIDSYRNKRSNNRNNDQHQTNSFYNKNKKHARCDSALVMEERNREHLGSITKTTDLKETNLIEKRK